MTEGKLSLSLQDIQGHLRHLHDTRSDLTAEERYALNAAVQCVGFVIRVAPGVQQVLEERKAKTGL